MFLNKVEICGVNTSDLPLLSEEEKNAGDVSDPTDPLQGPIEPSLTTFRPYGSIKPT